MSAMNGTDSPTMTHAQASERQYLQTCVMSRHSIRYFTADAVSDEVLHDCAALAQHAPSNSNIQNWRLYLAKDAAKDRVVSALSAEAHNHGPNIGPVPDEFMHFRKEMGAELYGPEGYDIAHGDKKGRMEIALRNYEFFGAPVVGVVTMNKKLTHTDSMSVGMFVQTFVLALTERGLGTCLMQSVIGYPDVLHEQFQIPKNEIMLAGIAIGYPAENRVNKLVIPRETVDKAMKIMKE